MSAALMFKGPIFTQEQAAEVEIALRDRIEQLTERRARFEKNNAVRFAADVTANIQTCERALLAVQRAAPREGVKL